MGELEQSNEERPDLSTWTPDQLITRIGFLEQQLREQTVKYNSAVHSPKIPSPARSPKNTRVNREFDPSKYTTRFIALKFAYLGRHYNGLEFHPKNETPLPTIEEELWKALNKARLVLPTPNPLLGPNEPNWEGCEYSKCGRTDKGVSAFGQVIGLRVRSNRPINRVQQPPFLDDSATEMDAGAIGLETTTAPVVSNSNLGEDATPSPSSVSESISDEAISFHTIRDEIPYCQVLNRLLPPDIRALAWCPHPPSEFSARFSCTERRYKYFFTQPAFAPTKGSNGLLAMSQGSNFSIRRRREGWLNIEAMRQAAHKFVGLHDFRNFCKVDPSKQIDNFQRRIFHADVEKIDSRRGPVGYVGKEEFQQYDNAENFLMPQYFDSRSHNSTPAIYAFTLHGSAFLWHQVRHMVAILFLVGQGLEPISIVDDLLDVSKTPSKPQYEMADDAPLVLWDCVFSREGAYGREDALDWVYAGDENSGEAIGKKVKAGMFGRGGIVDDLWRVWRGRKMDEVLVGSLLDVVVGRAGAGDPSPGKGAVGEMVFQGGDAPRSMGKYVPLMKRARMETVEVINAKYAKRKGREQGAREMGEMDWDWGNEIGRLK